MTQTGDNPVELFGMRVAHVGINAKDPEDAARIADDFSVLMGLPVRDTPISVFSGTLVETMKGGGRGTCGHIGFHVDDLEAAVAWFAERGLAIDEGSRKLAEDGSTRLVYFDREVGGFAIHLTTDN